MELSLPAEATRFGPINLFVLTPESVGVAYVGWLNDPQINRYLETRFVTHTLDSTRDFVAGVLADPRTLMLGMSDPAGGAHIGNIKLGPIDVHHGTGDIGLLIGHRGWWGKGVGTAAIKGIEDIARRSLDLRKLTAGVYSSNIGSRRAFEKRGFAIEGVRRDQFLLDGIAEDHVLLGKVLRPA